MLYSSSIRIVQVSGFARIGWVRGAVDAIGPARWRQRSDARECGDEVRRAMADDASARARDGGEEDGGGAGTTTKSDKLVKREAEKAA